MNERQQRAYDNPVARAAEGLRNSTLSAEAYDLAGVGQVSTFITVNK